MLEFDWPCDNPLPRIFHLKVLLRLHPIRFGTTVFKDVSSLSFSKLLRGLSSSSDSGFLLFDARTPIDCTFSDCLFCIPFISDLGLKFLLQSCLFSLVCGVIESLRPPIPSVSHPTQVKTRFCCKKIVEFQCSFMMKEFNWGTKLMKMDLHGS